jgi:hypothetical protein
MNRLRVLGEIVLKERKEFALTSASQNTSPQTRLKETDPEHISILEMGLRVPLLGVNEVRELGRVADEEHWGVVEDPVPVAFVGAKLDRETTGVASGIC